ncbi:MAG: hypothetical protein ABJM11_17815, partial [Marinobacter sp.]|uniref:hypothetical protein n=1 Tax=Marinobacter sp. TaxID=50741 RepID=UPI0032999D89
TITTTFDWTGVVNAWLILGLLTFGIICSRMGPSGSNQVLVDVLLSFLSPLSKKPVATLTKREFFLKFYAAGSQ